MIYVLGGGAPLNYKVVGGTSAPSNPKENTIWVNTSTAITSHVFSATQPTGSAGMVWINMGVSGSVEFNALKKNGIQVYPLSAKQYVSGAWVDKTAKIYQGGKWVEWITYLYNRGFDNANLTGGWYTASGYGSGYGSADWTVNIGSNYMQFAAGNGKSGIYSTKNKVDLTNVNTLYLVIDTNYSNAGAFHVLNNFTLDKWTPAGSVANATLTSAVNGVVSLSVSALSGSYYIAYGLSTSNGEAVKTVRILEVKMA